jgi:hypothetical protein
LTSFGSGSARASIRLQATSSMAQQAEAQILDLARKLLATRTV